MPDVNADRRSFITGWDASNPPDVERAYRVGFRAAA